MAAAAVHAEALRGRRSSCFNVCFSWDKWLGEGTCEAQKVEQQHQDHLRGQQGLGGPLMRSQGTTVKRQSANGKQKF